MIFFGGGGMIRYFDTEKTKQSYGDCPIIGDCCDVMWWMTQTGQYLRMHMCVKVIQ
jgi:hypothetical protein